MMHPEFQGKDVVYGIGGSGRNGSNATVNGELSVFLIRKNQAREVVAGRFSGGFKIFN